MISESMCWYVLLWLFLTLFFGPLTMVAYAMTRYFERDYVLVAMQMFVSGVVYILMSWITHDKNLFQVKNIIRNRK